jgi:hypothetical protein
MNQKLLPQRYEIPFWDRDTEKCKERKSLSETASTSIEIKAFSIDVVLSFCLSLCLCVSVVQKEFLL